MTDFSKMAQWLDDAARSATAIPQLSTTTPISIDDAYEIQRLSIARRIARGERIVGMKLGFTSKAKMTQMKYCDRGCIRARSSRISASPSSG